jgi:5-methylcytosine-specific restriction endonuclease McrA
VHREQVICKGCGTQFESHQRNRIYCCKLCWFLLKTASLSFTTGVLGTCHHCKSLLTREAYDSGVSVPDFLKEHEACRRALLDSEGRPDDCRCRECKTRKDITTPLSKPPSARNRRTTHQKHRLLVLERDEYICQICFRPTDPDARPQDDRYPTLDHILSARDGDDEPDNLRTAHRWCNTMLGDAGLVNDELVRAAAQQKFRE